MSDNTKQDAEFLEAANAQVIADMVADPDTPEHLRVRMLNKLLEARTNDTFFATMFTESLSFGTCPKCDHKNHWLVPEEDLNQMGWVTHEEDDRVKRITTQVDCPHWQQACKKKKVVS